MGATDYVMLLVALAVPVVAVTAAFLQIRRAAPFLFDAADPLSVVPTDEGLTLFGRGRPEVAVPWVDITKMEIRTSDRGPWSDDVFWEVHRVDEAEPLVFSNASEGVGALLDVAPEHLAGFDHDAVIQAMAHVDNARFLVWSSD